MKIYKATEDDLLDIQNLYSVVHDAEEQGLLNIGWKRDVYPTRKTASDAIERGDMFVMRVENKLVAAAIINKCQLPCYEDGRWAYEVDEDKVMVLHTLVVNPLESGKRYGEHFVKYYEQYALEQQCVELRMDTQDKNVKARKLYAKLGYQEVDLVSVSDGFNGLKSIKLVLLEKRI